MNKLRAKPAQVAGFRAAQKQDVYRTKQSKKGGDTPTAQSLWSDTDDDMISPPSSSSSGKNAPDSAIRRLSVDSQPVILPISANSTPRGSNQSDAISIDSDVKLPQRPSSGKPIPKMKAQAKSMLESVRMANQAYKQAQKEESDRSNISTALIRAKQMARVQGGKGKGATDAGKGKGGKDAGKGKGPEPLKRRILGAPVGLVTKKFSPDASPSSSNAPSKGGKSIGKGYGISSRESSNPATSSNVSKEPTPSRSASGGSISKGKGRSSPLPSPTRSDVSSASSLKEWGTGQGVFQMDPGWKVVNISQQSILLQNAFKAKSIEYNRLQQRRKKLEDTAAQSLFALQKKTNNNARFIQQAQKLEGEKASLESSIKELESDAQKIKTELDPLENEVQAALYAVNAELNEMELPPKHENGLQEAFDMVGGSFDVIRQMPIWELDQKFSSLDSRAKLLRDQLSQATTKVNESKSRLNQTNIELNQISDDLVDRGYDPDELTRLQEKSSKASAESASFETQEIALRKETEILKQQNDLWQKGLSKGMSNPDDLSIKTYCKKGPNWTEHGNMREMLAHLTFSCQLFLGQLALTEEMIEEIAKCVQNNGTNQTLVVNGTQTTVTNSTKSSPRSSPTSSPEPETEGSAQQVKKKKSVYLRTTAQQCRILESYRTNTHGVGVRRASSFEVVRACLLPGLKHFFVLDPELNRAIMTRLTRIPQMAPPRCIKAELRPYQLKGFRWLCMNADNGFGSILADDMGLGKTLQAICLISYLRSRPSRPVCVVVPAALLLNWQRELKKWAPVLNVHMYHGNNRTLHFLRCDTKPTTMRTGRVDVMLTSYGVARSDVDKLAAAGNGFEAVILDEVQAIKNYNAKITVAIKRLADVVRANVRVALSGTPVENRLEELHSIYEFTMPSYFESREHFKKNFCKPLTKATSTAASSMSESAMGESSKAQQRLLALTGPFQLRRLKTDKKVISDLPDKVENDVAVVLVAEQKRLYESIRKKKMKEIEDCKIQGKAKNIRSSIIFSMLILLRQVCNHPLSLPSDQYNFSF